MRRLAVTVWLLTGLFLPALAGCQSWGSALPDLTTTKDERLAVQQAKNDPFPSPADVGLEGLEPAK